MPPKDRDQGRDNNKGGKGKKGKGDGGGKDKIDRDQIEEEYGLSYSLFKSFPELEKLLKKAVAGSWTAQKFQVELRQTKWFEKHSDTWRQNIALKHSDPSTYRQRLDQTTSTLNNLARAYGVRLSNKARKRLGERALLLGWDEGQISNVLARFVKPLENGNYGGDLAGIENTLRNTALANGVKIGDKQLNRWMKQIVRGDASQEQFDSLIRDIASKTFEAYGEQIQGGMNLADIASPYIQSMSQILELNPGGIDLYDHEIRRALSYRDDKGQAVPMSITDFEESLRKDRRWQYTKNANDSARSFATELSKMWGLTS